MYYKERMISVAIYGILMLVFAFILKDSKRPKKILFIYTIILVVLAFLYKPNPGYDLERIYSFFSDYYSKMSYNNLIVTLKKSFIPTVNIFYYLISKSGIYGLAPAICCFIFFNSVFSVLCNVFKKYNIKGIKRSILLIFIMSMGTYLELISNLRTMTAFAIIFYCFYNEIANNKSIVKHIPLYLIASTTHLVALVVSILRFCIYPLQKNKWKLFYMILPLFIVMALYFYYGDVIEQISYTDSYYKLYVGYSYFPEYLLMSIVTIYILFIKIIHRKELINAGDIKIFNIFSLLLLIIMISKFSEYTIFHRIGTLHFLVNMPIMAKYVSLLKFKNGLYFMFFISMIALFLTGVYGNLSGFKFFVFGG